MTEQKLPRPSGDVVEDGVPATEEVRDEVLETGDAGGVGDMPMPDRPMGADQWGTTDFEERHGEPIGIRVTHETADVGDRFGEDGARITEPGGDADYADLEAESIADDDPARYDTLSAEEAAMHVVDEDDL
jgi:hypothetical protein